MKVKKFHQFIHLEKGPRNTAIIDFLKNNIFQVENEIIDKFLNREYSEISEFIEIAKQENLIIDIDDKRWIPSILINKKMSFDESSSFELAIEEGINFNLIKSKLNNFEITKILFYGKIKPLKFFPSLEIVQKEKNFNKCIELSKITGEFSKITKSFYFFNKKYNSCWGKKVAISKDNKVRPCIFSEIIIGDIREGDIYNMIDEIKKYWFITKDNVKKCKDCELRYVCFDCREIARRETGDLYASNPNCKYDPYTGVWL